MSVRKRHAHGRFVEDVVRGSHTCENEGTRKWSGAAYSNCLQFAAYGLNRLRSSSLQLTAYDSNCLRSSSLLLTAYAVRITCGSWLTVESLTVRHLQFELLTVHRLQSNCLRFSAYGLVPSGYASVSLSATVLWWASKLLMMSLLWVSPNLSQEFLIFRTDLCQVNRKVWEKSPDCVYFGAD